MRLMLGRSGTIKLENGKFLDISYYDTKWFTEINMSVWTKKRDVAVKFAYKKYFNYEKLLPLKVAEKIVKYKINKQSRKVAGIDLV